MLKLAKDRLGQLSLAVTTLFWGAGATLRLVIIAWAAFALSFEIDKATQLSAVVAFGVAIGSIIAARYISMKNAVKVLPLGVLMGIFVCFDGICFKLGICSPFTSIYWYF